MVDQFGTEMEQHPELEPEKKLLLGLLQQHRDTMLWKLDGLCEYDTRRPMTPTGTNLLGLVKHLATVELRYFTAPFGRPCPVPTAWTDNTDNADHWATADQSRAWVTDLYRRAWRVTQRAVEALALEAEGDVPWFPPERRETTLRQTLVAVIAETARHAGHADILREMIDGTSGLRRGSDFLPDRPQEWWDEQVALLENIAKSS
jgi:hypothetical protein